MSKQEVSFQERIQIVEDAVKLKKPERLPVIPFTTTLPFCLYGTDFRDYFYNHKRATEAMISYYTTFEPDAVVLGRVISGKANELAGSSMIDWPGRPGTTVPNSSTHQVIEREYMDADEYPELLRDFTGFMLRKYIPRAFPGLAAFSGLSFLPTPILNTNVLAPLYSSEMQDAYSLLGKIGGYDHTAADLSNEMNTILGKKGFPPFFTQEGGAPYDTLGDYFRGTIGIMMDQLECPEMVLEACNMFADIQIAYFKNYFKENPDLPVKRVFFPLHKGMDGFMSPEAYETLYWKPLKKIMMALIDMDVTPFIYTEGQYNTRIEQLADVPRGKVIYHFEEADMARAKKILGGVACISGNMPVYLLEYGTKEEVADAVKNLIDTCAPGGGYIFDTNAAIDNAKRENIEVMFKTCRTYG